MNQRVPESSGLPLRAMVMVLLFLAVVFLLLGLRAAFSDDDSSNSSSTAATTSAPAAATTTTPPAAPAKVDVHVYNMSTVEGAAASTGEKLNPERFVVTTQNFPPDHPAPSISATSVYFDPGKPGEKESADEAASALGTGPSEPRPPELGDLPAGLIVLVM